MSKRYVTLLGSCTVTDKFLVNVLPSQRLEQTGKIRVTQNTSWIHFSDTEKKKNEAQFFKHKAT